MSMSSNTSSSTSTPTVTQTPENDIMNQISGVASGLAQQMLGWASGVFAKTSAVTDQAVGNFFNVSQQMGSLSNNLTSQYNNLFAPENAQLVADANSYASPERMAVDMGQAGARQAQAGDAALKNSEADLRSYGIDPSSGRYAALDKAAAVQNAANVAGAENTQRNADIAMGQKLRSEAVQVGATLPAAIANVNNTAIQANTGASNASLANANTGANLMKLPNDYLGTAMGIKMPLQGQKSNSVSNGMSSSPDRGGGGGGGSGSGGGNPGGGNPYGSSGPGFNPVHGDAQLSPSSRGGGGGGSQPSAGIRTFGGNDSGANWSDPTGQNYDPMSGIDPSTFDGTQGPDNSMFSGGSGSMTVGQPGSGDTGFNDYNNPFGDSGFGQTLPQDNSGFGGQDQTFGNMSGGANTEWGNISYDPQANQSQLPSGWQDPAPQTDWGGGGGGWDTSGAGGSMPDLSNYSPPDSSGWDSGGAMNFAAGGAIDTAGAGPTTGGGVPPQASPTAGQQTDDVPANLNVGEFVIPRDVAMWKGQEFFQNLIDQSRKKRVMAPAQGKPGQPGQPNPAATQAPTFQSRPMR